MGDAEKGRVIFNRICASCHTTGAGEANKNGPNLNKLFGRKAGSSSNYGYSDATRKSGITWNDKTLDTFLENPKKTIPGCKMVFPGIKKSEDRQHLIAYLKKITK